MNKLKKGGSKEIRSLNGINYIRINFYEDLVFQFPLGKKNKKKFATNDFFARFSLEQNKIVKSHFVNKHSQINNYFIKLPKEGEIIEFTSSFSWVSRIIPIGIYRVENTIYNNYDVYDSLKCYIRNILNNILYEFVFYEHLVIDYRNIYLYIPITNEQNKIEECKKIISNNHTTKHIMHQLWNNRHTGDYDFYGIRAHSNIIRLNSDVIDKQLQSTERGQFSKNSHKFNFDPSSDPNSSAEYVPKNKTQKRIFNHTVTLILYLLYFNNLAQYTGFIDRDILEYSLLFCDVLGINNNIIEYIQNLLTHCYNN